MFKCPWVLIRDTTVYVSRRSITPPLSLPIPPPLSLDETVVNPEDPMVETLSPFARVDEVTGKLIYEEGSSEATVFPGNTLYTVII